MATHRHRAAFAILTASLATSCGGGGGDAPSMTQGSPATTVTTAIDPAKVPLGDGKVSLATPAVGYIFACSAFPGGGGASVKGPWFNSDGTTWNSTAKIGVQGSVTWPSSFAVTLGSTRDVSGNGLPSYGTGVFPIASTDPAFAYDRNPNSIRASAIAWGLPANPAVASSPSCLSLGAIGVLLDGVRLFNALDAQYRDAGAWEVLDSCAGHPEASGQYHHHTNTSCLGQLDTAGQHSPIVGYIADGFGIYGNLGENGKALANADLDECHGHTHAVNVNGLTITQYHYHMTREYPYTVGCYRGTPATIR